MSFLFLLTFCFCHDGGFFGVAQSLLKTVTEIRNSAASRRNLPIMVLFGGVFVWRSVFLSEICVFVFNESPFLSHVRRACRQALPPEVPGMKGNPCSARKLPRWSWRKRFLFCEDGISEEFQRTAVSYDSYAPPRDVN